MVVHRVWESAYRIFRVATSFRKKLDVRASPSNLRAGVGDASSTCERAHRKEGLAPWMSAQLFVVRGTDRGCVPAKYVTGGPATIHLRQPAGISQAVR